MIRHRFTFGFYTSLPVIKCKTTIIYVYTPVNRVFLVRKKNVSRRRFFCILTTYVLAEIINNNLDRELLYGGCNNFFKNEGSLNVFSPNVYRCQVFTFCNMNIIMAH